MFIYYIICQTFSIPILFIKLQQFVRIISEDYHTNYWGDYMKNKLNYIVFISVSVLTGLFSALLTRNNMNIYDTINTPPLSPPGFLFPFVWTILYILMGVSAARVYTANKNKWSVSLTVWSIQLAVNFFWSILFFNFQAFLLSFIWLVLLLILIMTMIILFYKADKTAGLIQIPYFLWVTFAGYLNFAIYLLN